MLGTSAGPITTCVRGSSSIGETCSAQLRTVDMETAEVHELVTGEKCQPLYWLAFVARHRRAHEFWQKIRDLEPDPQGVLL
jgi:hypothetical protein